MQCPGQMLSLASLAHRSLHERVPFTRDEADLLIASAHEDVSSYCGLGFQTMQCPNSDVVKSWNIWPSYGCLRFHLMSLLTSPLL